MVEVISILTGLSSGFAGGVLTVEVRARRERRLSQKQWYDRIIRLAQRVIRASEDQYDEKSASYVRDACAGILGNISQQIMNAPNIVSDELLDNAEALAISLQAITEEHSPAPTFMQNHMSQVLESARMVTERAEQEREEVPLL